MDSRPLFVGYPRVSHMGRRKADSDDFHAVRDQARAMQVFADGLDVALEIAEPDLNAKGTDEQRRELLRIIEGVEEGRYAGVLVAYLSRLTRSTSHALELWRRVRAAGGRVIAIREGIDSAHMTPHSWYLLKIISGADELVVDLARENFDAQRAAAVAAGIWAFPQKPIGYDRDEVTRRLVPNGRADEARWAFRSAGTVSRNEIARRLKISPGSVTAMLKNRVYLGELHVGGRLQTRGPLAGTISPKYENLTAHEPIITEDEWLFAQAALAPRPPRSERQTHPAMLSLLATCGGCGHHMTRTTQKHWITYRCRRAFSGGTCEAPASITMQLLDDHVSEIVVAHLQQLRERAHRHNRPVADARAELDAARAELAAYLEMVDAADIGVANAAAGARRRHERVTAAERRLAAELARQPLAIETDPEKVWNESDVSQRNQLSRGLIEAVVVYRVGRGRRVPPSERVRVIAHGAGLVARGGTPRNPLGIRPIPMPDLDSPVVLRVG